MIEKLHDAGLRSEHAYVAGFASIGLSFLAWATSKKTEQAGTAVASEHQRQDLVISMSAGHGGLGFADRDVAGRHVGRSLDGNRRHIGRSECRRKSVEDVDHDDRSGAEDTARQGRQAEAPQGS